MSCCSQKTLFPNLTTWSKVQTWYWKFLFCPKCGEILEGAGSLGLMGIPLVGDRSGIIPAVHVLDNLFTPECDISVLCKGKKTLLLFAQAVEKMSIKQKMNEYLCKMFRGNYKKIF